MLEYLIWVVLWSTLVIVAYSLRDDLAEPMLWSGVSYALVMGLGFGLWKLISLFTPFGEPLVPGYFSPPSLFNLAKLYGGFSIESLLFTLVLGAVCALLYPLLFKKGFSKPNRKPRHIAPVIAALIAVIIQKILLLNLIYMIIIFGLATALIIWIQRKDLIRASLVTGIAMLGIYLCGFILFNQLFPYYLQVYYHFQAVSGMLLFGVPLEELVYALTLGMAWGVMYNYFTGRSYA